MEKVVPDSPAHRTAAWRAFAPLQWLGSVFFTVQLFLLAPVWGAVITLVGWLPFRALYVFARGWAGSNMWLAKKFCGLDWVVEGRENIPHEGAHISMWKHTSAWETMAQMV
jgi:1-acyl-sn-glycerol-3-phosphate acyltransferase